MARLEERTIYLLGPVCQVTTGATFDLVPPEVCIFGLFDVIEFCPYEPSNYVWSPYFLVCPHGQEEGPCYALSAQDYDEQVNPKSHALNLRDERDMDNRELLDEQEE